MSRDPRLYLTDMVEACQRITRASHGRNDTEILADETTRDAILFNLIVIGEAAARVPEDVRAGLSSIPWERLRGMRNVVAHQYFGLNEELVLDVIRNKVPPLLQALRDFLNLA